MLGRVGAQILKEIMASGYSLGKRFSGFDRPGPDSYLEKPKFAAFTQRYRTPLLDTTELLRRKKPKYESDAYILLAEAKQRLKNTATVSEINKHYKALEKEVLSSSPAHMSEEIKKTIKRSKDLDLKAIKEDIKEFKEDEKEIRKLINKLKGKEKNRTEMNSGGVSMLKPDYIDLDGDGNKTEPMKEAAKDAKKEMAWLKVEM